MARGVPQREPTKTPSGTKAANRTSSDANAHDLLLFNVQPVPTTERRTRWVELNEQQRNVLV
jgi:hypothetical protein